MNCFIMKALTLKGDWVTFTLEDIPTRFNMEEFALLKRPNSPRLNIKSICRGDTDTGLFEGDIIYFEDCEWLVCYERGFYVINENYVTRTLDTFCDFKLIGDCFSREFPIPILKRNKCLFKYKDTVFRLEDIVGAYGDCIILRCLSNPLPISEIKQDAGILINKQRMYFGDITEDGTLDLYKGRIAFKRGQQYYDTITGGLL